MTFWMSCIIDLLRLAQHISLLKRYCLEVIRLRYAIPAWEQPNLGLADVIRATTSLMWGISWDDLSWVVCQRTAHQLNRTWDPFHYMRALARTFSDLEPHYRALAYLCRDLVFHLRLLPHPFRGLEPHHWCCNVHFPCTLL